MHNFEYTQTQTNEYNPHVFASWPEVQDRDW